MRKAGEVICLIFEKLEDLVQPGITTAEIDRLVLEWIRKKQAIPSFLGYEGPAGAGPYPASICASVNEEVIHGIPGLRRLEDGDILSVDVGVCLQDYHADAARTFEIGKTNALAHQLVETAKQCFFRALEQAREGNRISDLSETIQKHAEEQGFSVVRKYIGHGIGRNLHEPPDVPNYRTRSRGPLLAAGMTLAMEPMINEGTEDVYTLENGWTVVTRDHRLSAHYENTIAITRNEPLVLTIH